MKNLFKGDVAEALGYAELSVLGRIIKRIRTVVAKMSATVRLRQIRCRIIKKFLDLFVYCKQRGLFLSLLFK